MLNEKLTKAVENVIEEIRETPEYKDYREKKQQARADRKTSELIEKARSLQNRLMEIPEDERNSDYADSLRDEYEEIAENTAVYDYSRAEAIYMTMLQEVLGGIVECADIDV